MKKFTLLMAFFMVAGLAGIQAQAAKKDCAKACAKTCSKSKEGTASTTADAAALLASQDESIEQKVCETSGKVSYIKTVENSEGVASTVNVKYDASIKQFVNMAPTEKGCCSGASSCCSGKAGKKAAAEGKKKSSM